MIIHTIASEIFKWVTEHDGAAPKQLRISKFTMDCIEDDMRNMQLYPDPESKAKGETRIAGILIVVDPAVTIGAFDA